MLARDCDSALENNIPKIEELRKQFNKSYVVIIENDSKDNTKSILHNWAINSKEVFVISEDTGKDTIPSSNIDGHLRGMTEYRIGKMAAFRNKYLDFVALHDNTIDYLINVDIDVYDFNVSSIVQGIENAPDDWTALLANGRLFAKIGDKIIPSKYYDNFAYVPFDNEHYDVTFEEMYLNSSQLEKALKRKSYVQCKSAFGGLGIFKYQYIKGFHYQALKNSRSELMESMCEHISLCKHLNKFGTNYIVSNMQLWYEKIKTPGDYIVFIIGNRKFIKLWEFIRRRKFR